MVFVPGFMQPGDAWASVAEGLPERYPSVLLGHAENSFEGRLAEIAAAGEGAVLCGYSMGGRLVLHAALRDPARYAGLVTVGASAGIEAPATRAARAEADEKMASWMETQPIEQIVDVWERQPLFADQSDQLVEAQRPGRLQQNPRGLAMLLRTAGQGTLRPIWQQLHDLQLAAGQHIPLACGLATLDLFDARIASALPSPSKGLMAVPQGPGLGVEVSDDALAEVLVEEVR